MAKPAKNGGGKFRRTVHQQHEIIGASTIFVQGAFCPEQDTSPAKHVKIHMGQSVGAAAVHDVYADAVNACTGAGYRHIELAGLAGTPLEPEPQQPLQVHLGQNVGTAAVHDVYADAVNARTGAGYRHVELAGLAGTPLELEPEPQQPLQPPLLFDVSLFKRLKDTTPKNRRYTWSDLCNILSKPKVRHKKDGMLISGATFTGQRSNSAVDSISLLALDYDHAANMEHALEVWRSLGFQYITYTTFNHGTEEKPSAFHLMLPLAEPMPGDKYPALWAWAQDITGGMIDPACKDLSRAMYLPACPPDREHLFHYAQGDGKMLNWRELDLSKYEEKDDGTKRFTGPVTPDLAEWIRQAVFSIDPACDYERWRNVGFILFDVLGDDGFSVWEEWTRPRSTKRNSRLRPHWNAFKSRGNVTRRIGLNSLANMAREYGFTAPCPAKILKHKTWGECRRAIRDIGRAALPSVAAFIGKHYNPIAQGNRLTYAWFELSSAMGYPQAAKKVKMASCAVEKCQARMEDATKNGHNEFDELKALHATDQALIKLAEAEAAFKPIQKELEAAREEITKLFKAQALAEYSSFMKEITAAIEMTGLNIEIVNEQRLHELDVKKGETLCIQSDLGTGKTHQLAALIRKLEAESLPGLPLRIAVITPRRSLTKQAATRCELVDYEIVKHERAQGSKEWKTGTSKIAVTVNSLAGLIGADRTYDLVAIDESELLAGHLVGGTIKDKDTTLAHLYKFLRNAKRVVCLDAFLSPITLHMLEQAERKNIRILRNVHQAWKEHPIEWYLNRDALTTGLHNALNIGKKCFIATNGIRHAEKLYEGIIAKFPNLRGLLITQRTSTEAAQKLFMSNPNDYAKEYDFIVASPTIESGLSVDTDHFSETFGFFFSGDGTGTALAAIQSLARNRKARKWHVWVDDKEQYLPINASVIIATKAAIYDHAIKSTGLYSSSIDLSGNPVAMLDCAVTAWSNKQKTNMSKSAYAFLANMGCSISRAAVDAVEDHDFGAEMTKIGREIRNDKRAEKILDATKITDTEEAEIIEAGPDLEQSYKLERKQIEREYITDLEADRDAGKTLVLADNDGEVIAQIKRIEEGLAPRTSVLNAARIFLVGANDFDDGKKHPVDKKQALIIRAAVKRALFDAAGIDVMPNRSINAQKLGAVEWDNNTLRKTKWFELCKNHVELVNAVSLGTKLKPGWEKNSARHFGEMLKACGLDTESERRELQSDPYPASILKEKRGGVDQKQKRKFIRAYRLKQPDPKTSSGKQGALLISTVNRRAVAGRNWVDIVWKGKQQQEAGQEATLPSHDSVVSADQLQQFTQFEQEQAEYNAALVEFGVLASWGSGLSCAYSTATATGNYT